MTTLVIAVLLVGCFAVHQTFCNDLINEDVSDYYWREYTGVIPSDAIPGGTDVSGKRTYIGQAYTKKHGLLPGTIYGGSKGARSSGHGISFNVDTYVKVLCSRNHDRYKWIPTKNEETHLMTNCHLVIGGTEADYVLNIGRVNHEMETIVGKIFAHHTPYKGLIIPNKDAEIAYQTYEILTYNCNRPLPHENCTHVDVVY